MTPAESQARDIVRALEGKPSGSGWVCRCPCPGHIDKHPSFGVNVKDGKLYVHCLAGCSQDDVTDALWRMKLWNAPSNGTRGASHSASTAPRDPVKSWRNAGPFARNSTADVYLKRRGIELTDDEARSLRFSPSLFHWPTKTNWPAMLARVALATGESLTTHQTFLKPDGSDKAPLGKQARLFIAGARTIGGGVWFGTVDSNREFIVGEGIESTLSAMRRFGVTAGCAALSAGGIGALILPPEAKLVRIYCDNDERGQSVAAAREAFQRWSVEGRVVKATRPREVGLDANDLWKARLRAQANKENGPRSADPAGRHFDHDTSTQEDARVQDE